jgi:adenosylcobinamide kinase / adenosylcobinamide-phosphate guanylyltransferase
MIIFVTGGARSGKSSHAQEMALSLSDNPVYVATAKVWDGDFERRVKRHQNERDKL